MLDKRLEHSELRLTERKPAVLIFPNGGQAIERDIAPWGIDEKGRSIVLITMEPQTSFKHYYRIQKEDYFKGYGFLTFRCPETEIYPLGKSPVFETKLIGIDFRTRRPMLLDNLHQLLKTQLNSALARNLAFDSENAKLRQEVIRLSRETYGPTQIAAAVSADIQKLLLQIFSKKGGDITITKE